MMKRYCLFEHILRMKIFIVTIKNIWNKALLDDGEADDDVSSKNNDYEDDGRQRRWYEHTQVMD